MNRRRLTFSPSGEPLLSRFFGGCVDALVMDRAAILSGDLQREDLATSVRNAVGFSSACFSRYFCPPFAASAARIMALTSAFSLFGVPFRRPPVFGCPLAAIKCSGLNQSTLDRC